MSDLADMITAAEAAVVDARSAAAFANVHPDDLAAAVQAHRSRPLVDAVRKLSAASADVEKLQARADRIEQARLDHATAEATHNETVTADAKKLAESHRRRQAKIRAAQETVRAMFDEERDHDALVAEIAARHRANGLPASYQDGDVTVEFETGGGTGRDGVKIRGAWSPRVDPDDAVAYVQYGLMRSVHGLGALQTNRARSAGITRLQRSGATIPPLPDAAMPPARTAQPAPIEAAA